jgi:hypothetical protein
MSVEDLADKALSLPSGTKSKEPSLMKNTLKDKIKSAAESEVK